MLFGDCDHGMHRNAFGGTENGLGKDVFKMSSRPGFASREGWKTRRRTLEYAHGVRVFRVRRSRASDAPRFVVARKRRPKRQENKHFPCGGSAGKEPVGGSKPRKGRINTTVYSDQYHGLLGPIPRFTRINTTVYSDQYNGRVGSIPR